MNVAEEMRSSPRAASQPSVQASSVPPRQSAAAATWRSPVACSIASSAATGPSSM